MKLIRYHHPGLFHFTFGASPQHILLHFPIHLLHFPNKFASFPQQIASFPQQNAAFPQQITAFPQPFSHFPNTILCHFAKNKIIKIQTSAHKNPDICSLNFANLTVVMEMMVFDNEAHVEVNQEVDKEVTKVVE